MAAVQVTVARQADEDRIEASIRMGLFAVPLEPVTVSARSRSRSDGSGPGSSERSYNPEQLARLPINASDLNTVAALQPGILGIRESDSTATAFSVARQRPTANHGGTLAQLGVSPDTAARFLALAAATGVPVTLPTLPDDRSTNTTLALLRLDWQASDVHTLTLRLDGSWESQEPTRVGTLTLPTTGGTRTTFAGGVMASLTSYFGGRFINELRGYAAQQRRDARAFLALPAAVVDVASDLPNGGQGVAALAFGGSWGLPQHIHNRSLEIADEFSWLPGRTAHRLKLGMDVIGTRVDEGQTANQLGTFIYPSLAALAADSPATFTRTLAPRAQAGTAWNAAAFGAPGLANAETELICVGSAVPIPDWSRYAQDPSTIPSQCQGAAAVPVAPRPNVTAFAPGFGAPRARRGSLALLHRFGSSNYWVTLEGSYARGVSQYGFRDLNLVAAPRFGLGDEAGRPVYVPADSIVPATGAVNSAASRAHPEFGRVLLVDSDLQSDTKQLTLSLTGATAGGAAFRLAYTLTRARDQSSFSCCSASAGFTSPTTGGDPDAREWSRSSLDRRHALVGTVTLPITRALDVSAIGSVASGVPFTPIVGSDINGDGAKNDRAFVFNPAFAPDVAGAKGMAALLPTPPPRAPHRPRL